MHPHRRLHQSAQDARDHRGAGAGAAGQGLARATFEHAQAHGVRIHHLQEAGIDARRKALVALDQRALRDHRRGIDVGDHLHRVRVAHRHRGDRHRGVADLQRLHHRVGIGYKGHLRRRKLRHAHVHRDQAVCAQPRRDDPGPGLDADLGLRSEPLVVDEAHEAACAVAALFDLAAVGVEDAVAEIDVGAGRRLDHQQLITADAAVAVGDRLDARGGEIDRRARGVDDDEVVAQAVHLGEAQFHLAVQCFSRSAARPRGGS